MNNIMSQTDDQREAEIERRAQERVVQLLDANSTVPDMIAVSVERAMRRVLNDEELRRQFWAAGYRELEQHAGTNAAQWIGRRIINIVIVATVAGVLAWFVVTGRGPK
jgi:capsular polysaccharide biosynthesis protein